jgi:ligand-binding sensor domain-containing protein/class 3 adenylate cyclase
MNEKSQEVMAQNRSNGFNHLPSCKFGICALLFFGLLCSCQSNQKTLSDVEVHPIEPDYIIVEDLPAPLIAKYIDPDSVSPPVVVPLKKQPKVFPAHPNVHQLMAPEVVEVPDNLTVIALGQDGILMPETIPVKGKIVPALQPKPIPATAMRTKDGAIYNIQVLSDEQGLNSLHIISMLEDSRGHIWFGTTSDGVIRFDGQNLFQYTTREGLINKGVRSMVEDRKGNIWFSGRGGNGGICYYDGLNFVHFTSEHGLGENGSDAVMEDSKGNIWFYSKDLYRFDGTSFTIYKKEDGLINDAEKQKGYFSDNSISIIYEDSQGDLWLGTQGNGVLKFDGRNITHLTEKQGLIDNYIGEIMEDSHGDMWFGSGGAGKSKGLSRYTPRSKDILETDGTFTNYNTEHGLRGNRITGLLEDHTGAVWISTFESGISHFDGRKFTDYTTEEGLGFNSILCLLQDSKGNIWAGSNGGGVSRIQPNSFRFYTEKQGLNEFGTDKIFEDYDNNLWMSKWGGGVIKYDGENFTNYTEAEGLLQDFVTSITQDSKGNYWFATRDNGICRFDGQGFTYYTSDQGIFNNFHYDIHVDKNDQVWVASGWDGVNRLNPETGAFTHFIGNPKEGIGGAKLFEDKKGNLWFGGSGYLAKYNREQDQIDFVCQVDTLSDDLINTNDIWIEHMLEDDNNNLWIGSAMSIIQVVKNGIEIENDFPKYSKGNQLPDKKIISMSIDKNKNLWLSQDDNGIAVLQGGLENLGHDEKHWIVYGKADGLKSKNPGITFIDGKNQLWLGRPVSMLDLNTFQFDEDPPENLELSYIEVNQKHLDYQHLSDSTYRSTFTFGEALFESFESVLPFQNVPLGLELPYYLNHLTFNFSAIDWQAPQDIKYSYFMEGLDKEWSEPSFDAKAEYRPVPYGNYTFKVKAIGQANVWTDPIEYTFTVLPPWWHTWWAYIIYALIMIGAIGTYIQRLRQKIKQKQKQIETEQFLNQELTDLNLANGRFVPYEFLDILGKKNLKELRLGDQTAAKMTVLFSDIRDYTGISEKMSPEDNFKLINAFLGRMGPIIKDHGGFICLYTGDGIMALFKDNHEMAVKAAIEMQKSLSQYNKKRFVANRRPINIGIGLNTGKLMLGVIGDNDRYDTSVVSDAVNTASRMEGLTKVFGSQIIVSEETLKEMKISDSVERTHSTCGDFRFLGKVRVKGKDKTLKIYDFYDWEVQEIQVLKSQTKEQFEQALEYYYNRKFGKAVDLFKTIIELFPEDVASKYYMEKSVKFILDGVDAEWNGVENFVNK